MQETTAPSNHEEVPDAIVALMGPTGTGKSTFINLLTNDENIRVGHDLQSQTFDVNTARYHTEAGFPVLLVDTPGFDDSREGVTDTDILRKIAAFLQEDGGRRLNGVIYLHRISDPRLGGQAKKNLRVFRELCGDKNLSNVRIITTYWNRVDESEGSNREAALAAGAFKPFLDAGATLFRHDKELESAQAIVAELIHAPPVMLQIQEELEVGMALGDTSAGAVIIEEMRELQKKHERDVEDLKKEIQEAANANDDELVAEIAEERRKLEALIAKVETDRKRLETKPRAREPETQPEARKQAVAVDHRDVLEGRSPHVDVISRQQQDLVKDAESAKAEIAKLKSQVDETNRKLMALSQDQARANSDGRWRDMAKEFGKEGLSVGWNLAASALNSIRR